MTQARRTHEIAGSDLWRDAAGHDWSLFDARAFSLFLRRNAWRLVIVSVATGAAAFAASVLLFTAYSATAVLVVDPRATKVTRAGGVISNIGGDAIAIESIVQIARSEGFLGELIDEQDLTKNPPFVVKGDTPEKIRLALIDKLASRLTIARRGTTYVIDITASAASPEASARLANAAANKILTDQTALRTGVSATTAREIESRLSEMRGRVSRAEQAAAELKARLKVTDAGQGSTLLERRISELNQQLVLASARTAEARAHLESLRKGGATAGDNLPQNIQSSVLGALRAEYARLSRLAAEQGSILGPKHPATIGLNAQISDLKRQIAAEIGRMMVVTRTEFAEAEQREADLSQQLRALQTESGDLGPQMVKLDELEREAKAERAVYEELLNRQRELLQVKDLEPSDIRLASRATPPTRPTPSRLGLAIGSLLVGLLAGLGYVSIREWRQDTLSVAAEAQRLEVARTLGFLPKSSSGHNAGESDLEVPDLTPWLDAVVNDLAPDRQKAEGEIILVTSTMRGEGRSTVAINLAASLAGRSHRTLLIEADRDDHLGRPPQGLLEALYLGDDLCAAFVEQLDDGYTLLPYGGRDVKDEAVVSALMTSVTLRATLKLARDWFDVIVIDSPPALESRIARFLATEADNVLFLVEWGKTNADDIEAALEHLEAKNAALLFNKADAARQKLYDPEQWQNHESFLRTA